jgi:hypothetical protein
MIDKNSLFFISGLIICIILIPFIWFSIISPEEIDKSDCMWTICNGKDIQWCGDYNRYLTAEYCCNGCPCSDTYYNSGENLCHLTLCENSPFTNKSQCSYIGKIE